ncbi:MAG: lamin tail domain-containing protein, partial [Minisyncoccales bacterium]
MILGNNFLKFFLFFLFLISLFSLIIFSQKIKNLISFLKEKIFNGLKSAGFFSLEKREKKPGILLLEENLAQSPLPLKEDKVEKEIKKVSKERKETIKKEEAREKKIFVPEEKNKNEKEEREISWCQYSLSVFPKREVIFNEIAWMGTEDSSFNEWIELKNISDKEIDLTGWQVQNQKGKIKVLLEGKLSSKDFYLLERSSDQTLPNLKADLIFTGSILNQDEALYLFDKDCHLEDVVFANPDWPGGISKKGERRTAERMKDLSWRSSSVLGGTPKKENTEGMIIVLQSEKNSTQPLPESSFPPVYISEVKISPLSERYIEIFNPNDFEVDLTGYYLQRRVSGDFSSFVSSSYFQGKKIGAKSFLLIVRDKTKFSQFQERIDIEKDDLVLTENNSLRLKDPKGRIIDNFSWTKISSGNSFGRRWQADNLILEELEEQIPTPKEKNESLPAFVFLEISSPEIKFFFSKYSREGDLFKEIFIFNKGSTSTQWFLKEKEEEENPLFSFSALEGSLEKNSSTTINVSFLADNLRPDIYERTFFLFYSKPDGSQDKIEINLKGIITTNEVVINEIAWAGTIASSYDEWLELKNNTTSSISLEGWKIFAFKKGAASPSLTIFLKKEILPQDFFLLERSDDETIKDISADQSFTSSLSNEGMKFELRDGKDDLVDFLDFSDAWPDGGQKISLSGKKIPFALERLNPKEPGVWKENWRYNNLLIRNGKDNGDNDIFGTPKNENSVFIGNKLTVISQS